MSLEEKELSRRSFLAAAGKALSVAGLATAGLSLDSEDAEAASVRVKHAPDVERDAIKTAAAVQSGRGNGIVITAYGDDADFHNGIIQGAIEAAGNGYPIIGVIIGDSNYNSEAEIYIDGAPYAYIVGHNAETSSRASKGIELAVNKYQEVIGSLENNNRQPT